jgi:two-component system, OmpR family, response regulator
MTAGVVVNGANASGKVVIGVDDAPENLAMLQAAVRAGGFSFFGAESGRECLTLLNRVVPRLVLMDIEMPDMDGFEVCRRIRMIPEMRQVPVAFLTVRRTPEDVKHCLDVGGNDFIIKPFDIVKLLERVRHWTSRPVRA